MSRDNRTPQVLDTIFDWAARSRVDLARRHGLDVFAGNGERQAQFYADRLASLEMWEMDEDLCTAACLRFPRAQVRCVDSVQRLRMVDGPDRYGFVAVDNPLGLYGPENAYCEHFEVVSSLHKVLASSSMVLLDVVPKPYSAGHHPEWMARRAHYYGVEDPRTLSIDFLTSHYAQRFQGDGLKTKDAFSICREYDEGVDYFWYLAFILERR